MPRKTKNTTDSHNLDNRNTQWHMALPSAIKLELMEYGQILQYTPEHLLNAMALRIDLLVIKKEDDTVIKNDIGRIFKRHNIIEYKSPHDAEGVNTYFKVYAYASLYKAGKDGKSYEPEDITITMIRRGKPVKLFQWLRQHGCGVDKICKGVYYVTGAGFFATQVIVPRELDEENNIWLTSLTDDMNQQQAKRLIEKSKELLGRPEAEYVDAVLQVVSKANREIFDRIKEDDENMYSALVELMRPEIDEAANAATAQKTVQAIENAIKKLKMSKEEACAFMDTTVGEYEAYKQFLKNMAAGDKK